VYCITKKDGVEKMIGKTISHYKILEKLSQGGMGIVYKAEDTKLKRTVALKFLPPELTSYPEAKERFIQEAQAASALDHANICTIHEIEETADGQIFIVMACYEGETLKDKIKDLRFLPAEALAQAHQKTGGQAGKIEDVIDIATQIALGLEKAHEKGITHRDIKPANIFITADGTVKILDFGLAKLSGQARLTKDTSTLGTVAYMSPEQLSGEKVDQRTDIWSLGVVLYEMLTGQLPFKGEYEQAVIYSILNENPLTSKSLKSQIPKELEQIINHCLEKDTTRRYQSVAEIIAELVKAKLGSADSAERNVRKITIGNLPTRKVLWASVTIVLILITIGTYLFYLRPELPSANQKSIAVLPFKNLSDSKEDEYFSDGITDDIIAHLSKISGLKVISHTSVMQYKGTSKNVRQIGNELDVGTVLEGSVRRAGDQVRIVAQLIDAQNEGHLWADTYDEQMTQIFAVQSDVAQKIASALKAKLTQGEKERIEKKQTENTEAYQQYLKGRFYWNKRTLENHRRAIEYFTLAIEKDSHYALAYAGLSSTYVLLPEYTVPSKEVLPKAEAAARRALELDPTLAEPHAVMGLIKIYEWDWARAETEFKKAIELDPNNPTAHQWYSRYFSDLGRHDEALAETKRAQELDPLSLIINMCVGRVLLDMKRFDQATDQFIKTLELDPNFPWAYLYLGQVHEAQGDFDQAVTAYKKAILLAGGDLEVLANLGHAYAKVGKRDEALKALAELLEYSKQGHSVSWEIALVYNGLGDKKNTLQWLEKAAQERNYRCTALKVDQVWNDLHSEPRFIALLKKMGLEK
jgi:serine/threonine protein kinase/Tfp pilus assembly protein PilF